MAETSVQRDSMRRAATEVESAAGTIRGIQRQIEGHATALAGGWKGQAATSFSNVMQHWHQDFSKVLGALDDIHEGLVHTEIVYRNSESEQQQSVSRIGARLNPA